MRLTVRPSIQLLPSYSLTGDLLGFLRCGLQYRYTRISNLPASHPVQLWFGQFIHAVLEESYRQIKEGRKRMPPWPPDQLKEIFDRIDRRLAARNIICWDDVSENLGRLRATAAVNELGPLLFPLINQAEVRVRGARKLPLGIVGSSRTDMDRYEMQGVIDVVTHVELYSPKNRGNKLLELVVEELPGNPPPEFEVIFDYKGMKRPSVSDDSGIGLWEIYEWQIHTYAYLRSLLTTTPIIAGVIVYLNELAQSKSDFLSLRKLIKDGTANDILPDLGSNDDRILRKWKPRSKDDVPPKLSLAYRLSRAIRVMPITSKSVQESLDAFDNVVGRIESCLIREASNATIIPSWERNPSHQPTCAACDSRTFCPDHQAQNLPRLPGLRI